MRTNRSSNKWLGVIAFIVLLAVILTIPVLANILSSAAATADCSGFTLTVNAFDLTVGVQYTIDYTFTLTCNGSPMITKTGMITFTASGSTATKTATGTWQTSPLSTNCTVIGSATLTSSNSTVTIIINGSSSASLTCALPQERMTGGGTVDVGSNMQVVVDGTNSDSFDVSHGFEIHCGAPPPKNNSLEVNWPDHHFHLDELTLGTCVCNPAFLPPKNPDAGFNEFIGLGTGKLDGVAGANIAFDFTDQGEPGTNDTEAIIIKDPGGSTVLSFPPTKLTFGDQQAHRVGGSKVPPCKGNGG